MQYNNFVIEKKGLLELYLVLDQMLKGKLTNSYEFMNINSQATHNDVQDK